MNQDVLKSIADRYRNSREHKSGCDIPASTGLAIKTRFTSCECYEQYLIQAGRDSMKEECARVVEQCIGVDATLVKLAQAIRDLD